MGQYGKKKAASATGQKGAIGETYVKGVLEELEWGPVPVSEHDSGTDFFVQVRDEQRTELGLLLGVQVKNEAKYFTKAAAKKAADAGFWEYQAKMADTEYWLDHAIPHVLILFNQQVKAAYWGHVTRDAVRWTNKAARIRVPIENTLGPATREELMTLAAESRRSIAWSPTAWKGVTAIHPARRLRTALLAPRVAAPRHLANAKPVLPETALARLMLGRFPDRPGRPHDGLPSEQEQAEYPFVWGLYHALWTYLETGEIAQFEAMAAVPAPSHERVALSAMRAAIAVENGDPTGALSVLEDMEDDDQVDPVDSAWLDAHRSRCLREVGDADGARDLALQVAAIGLLHAQDHGAVALRAAVLNNTFFTFEAAPSDRQLAASAADSPPVWWRDQHRAEALSEVLDRKYKDWANPMSRDVRPDTDAWHRLRGITLNAGLAADHRAWCLAMSQLSRYELSSGDLSDADRIAACLDDLRNCGDNDALCSAVNRLALDGPVQPLRDVTAKLDVTKCTRTNFTSSLEILRESIEVLPEPTLEHHARWVLQQLQDPSRLPKTDNTFSWLAKDYLLPTMCQAYRLLTSDGQALVRRHVVAMAPVSDQLLAESYTTLVRSIPHGDWTDDEVRALQPRAVAVSFESGSEVTSFGDHTSLGQAFNATLARAGDSDRLTALYEQLAAGNWQPLDGLGAIGDIPSDVLSPLIPHLVRDLDERAAQFGKGMWTDPTIYSGEVLLVINCTHPDLALWDPIQQVLEGRSKWDQASLARRLSELGDVIDEEVIHQLAPLLVALADDPDDTPLFNPKAHEAARAALLELTTNLGDPASLRRALAAGHSGRRAVARALGRRRAASDLALLAALATDTDPTVRAAAAWAATTWLRHDPLPAVQDILDDLLEEGGFANAYATMRALGHEQHNEAVHGILEAMSAHPSARVRWRAKELINDPETCRCSNL